MDRVVVTDADVEMHDVIPTTPASEQVRFCHVRTDYFHTLLLFVGPDQLLVGQLVYVEHIGGDQEGRFTLHRAGEGLLIDGDRRLELPLGPVGRRVLARASWSVLFGMGDKLR